MKKVSYWWKSDDKTIYPEKRYVILFNLFRKEFITSKPINVITSKSISEYENLKDCTLECDELDKLYKNHPKPILLNKNYHIYETPEYDYGENNEKSWWGYIVLDFKEKQCIRVGGYGFHLAGYQIITKPKQINQNLEILDYLFRDHNEVPELYDWDGIEEYKGWLQFRWGDGKNAVNYVKPIKQKKHKEKDIEKENKTEENDYAELENKYQELKNRELKQNMIERYGW